LNDEVLNLHAILPRSRANGPGVRFAIWFQGCALNCAGCFNPATHAVAPNMLVSVRDLVDRIASEAPELEGVTLSGGEPLQQSGGLLQLLTGIRSNTRLSVILFSGYEKDEIERLPDGPPILAGVDVLIAGRYDASLRLSRGLRGSSNQTIHLLTDRYGMEELERTPTAEAHIDRSGKIVISGVGPPEISE